MAKLQRTGDVFVLELGDDGNRFTLERVAELISLVEEVAAAPGPRALVTAASGKAWALGLDVAWIAAHRDRTAELVQSMHRLDAALLEAPFASVAAIQGHAFAGGALLALAHDERVMRADRGFFCLPEIDGRIAFTPGLTSLVRARVAPQIAHRLLVTGEPLTPEVAAAAGIVDELAPASEVLERAIVRAERLAGKDAATLGTIKRTLYGETLAALRDEDANRADAESFDAAIEMMLGAGAEDG